MSKSFQLQTEASDLQWGEGVEGKLGLVLVHEETLEVRHLVCGGGHKEEWSDVDPVLEWVNVNLI